MTTILRADNMVAAYNAAPILNGCTIEAKKGQVAVIVGPNGAGKSTAMKAITGILKLTSGHILFDGSDITSVQPQERVSLGMAFVPQTQNIFPSLTVEENLEMGGYLRKDSLCNTISEIYDLFPVLRDKRNQDAGELSGGQRQQVAVGRALMTRPRLLMLDEPTAGVSPIVMDELFDRILAIAHSGIAVLLVEQNARQALAIANTGYVLVQGENRHTDTGATLLANPEVRRSFLGG